jgi:hypothetical protein
MMPFNSCIICHKHDVDWHHIIKRKLKPNGITVPLCPKHHKLADLGKIEASELYRLRILEQNINGIVYEELEKQPWEAEYFDSSNFNNSHDFQCSDGELAFNSNGLSLHQYKRAKRISTWLNSSPNVGTYVFMGEIFSYLKKGVRARGRKEVN